MGSVMSLSCSKRKATSQDVESSSNESVKRRKICSMNDDDNSSLIPTLPNELSWKHPWTFCANSVFNVAAAVGFFTGFTNVSFQQDNKDTILFSLSLPSTSTFVFRIWKHPVFLSFHGADVRKTFLSHILESFRRKGIDPFIDNHIPKSKSIGPELIEAIRGSKIAIVLLSKNYASSSWCLDELVEIMKCREELSQIVMTIFYEVDPTEVKKQTGGFGKSFRKTCKGKTKEHIERWRRALEDVATIAGEHSHNWSNEAAMIEKIATDVSNMLNSSTQSRDFDGLVGMRAHMERMEQVLRLDLDEVRMIGIWGPPGIGKTTIARVLFNQVSNRFQLSALMVDIKGCYPRPCLDEYNAQLQLQKQMLSQIINQIDIMISHLGVAQERLEDKKVFLVLDDVDRLGQLNALAKEIQWFGPGSRIIITTEDLRVLKAHKINHIYKVKFPSSDEAFQFFCMHAFGQMHPDDGFSELAKEVTYLAGGLSLGLKVLGSALRGMSKQEWEGTLPRLKIHLDGEIESIIKFSYDDLCDEDRYLFLYIACLFNHRRIHEVERVLANKLSNVRQRLHVLAERSLMSIYRTLDFKECIEMHTLLKKFGRETSRKQFIYHGFRRRHLLVDARDIPEVLSDDTIDNSRFLGIDIDISEIEEELNISEKALETMSDLQFISIYRKNMDVVHPQRLHSLPQGLIYHSQKIRSLQWEYFQNICLPSTFNLGFLINLDMRYSKLQNLWEGTKQLKNLRWMDLSFSKDLKGLPDLSTATNLEELRLDACSSLEELPSSIGKLSSLQILSLSNCPNLVELPSISNATKLKHLNLSYCSSLVKLPSSINATNLQKLFLSNCSCVVELPAIENATNLLELNLDYCSSLLELPPTSGTATNLTILKVRGCSSLVKLPDSIGDMTNLVEIELSNCSSLVELPSSIGKFQNLKWMKCGYSGLVKLPDSIGDITNLEEINLTNCSTLVELPSSIGKLKNLKLMICVCSGLVKLPDSIGDMTNLEEIILSNCSSLVELPFSIGKLQNLLKLTICESSSLVKLPDSIGDMTNLEEIDISNCSSLVEIPFSIGKLQNLLKLTICGCSSLVKLPGSIGDMTNLEEIDISNCSSLMEIPSSIRDMTNLKTINLSYCPSLLEIPSFIGKLQNLLKLTICDCSSLVKLPDSIGDMTNLEEIDLSNCSSLVEISFSIGDMTNLKKINLSYCSSLVEIPSSIRKLQNLLKRMICGCSSLVKLPDFIGDMTNLEEIVLFNCSRLVEIPSSIGDMTNLEKINLSYYSSLVEIPSSIGKLQNLLKLTICGCSSIVKLPDSIGDMTNLKKINLSYCSSLVEIPSSIGDMTNLKKINLSYCSSLVEISSSIGKLQNLLKWMIRGCSSLVKLPDSIGDMTNLEEIDLSNCSCLVEIPSSIRDMTNLKTINLSYCPSLLEIPSSIGKLQNLLKLTICDCSSLVKLPDSIGDMTNLEEIDLSNCSSLVELPSTIGNLQKLWELKMYRCSSLMKLPDSIGDITNLKEIDLYNCLSLVELPSSIGNLQNLWKLVMCGCSKLEALPTNINLKSLSILDLRNCSRLKSFSEISTNIHYLNLTGTAIKEVPLSIMSWSRLFDFHMSYFENLKEFPHALDIITELLLVSEDIEVPPWVKGMSRLRVHRLNNCNNLVSLPQLSDSLSHIYAYNCKSLERLDCSFNNPKIRLSFPKCFNLNQEVRDLIMHTSSYCLPGTQVPACFNHRATAFSIIEKFMKWKGFLQTSYRM